MPCDGGSDRVVPLQAPLYEIDRRLPPLTTVSAGAKVTIETEDAFSGQIRLPGDRRDHRTMPYSNPVAGPICIDGAEPGDSIAVDILAIDPSRGVCATYILPRPPLIPHLGGGARDQTRVCPIRDGHVYWTDEVRLAYEPMIGVIAVAPAVGAPTTAGAADYGGNLDIREAGIGARILLPVEVPGAYLFIGDCHARQGDGEVAAVALEMAARVTVRVDVLKGERIPGLRIITPDALYALGHGKTLHDAVALGYSRLALWLEQEFEADRWETISLLSQVGVLSLGYYMTASVAAGIQRSQLTMLGYDVSRKYGSVVTQ